MTGSEKEAKTTTPEEVAHGGEVAIDNGDLDDLPVPLLEWNCPNLNPLRQQNRPLIQDSLPQVSLFSSWMAQSEMNNNSSIPKVQIQFPTEVIEQPTFDFTLGPTNKFVPISMIESVSQEVESQCEKYDLSNEHSDKEEGLEEDDNEDSSIMDSLDLLKSTPLARTLADFEKKYPMDLSQEPEDRNQIVEPNDNDVLFGRGGMTNHHPGNKIYRSLVEAHKADYNIAPTKMRPRVAKRIIFAMRNSRQNVRFLKRDPKTNTWFDVGDAVASSKCSQALREKSPEERQQIKKEKERKKAAGMTNTGVLYQKQVGYDLAQMPSLSHAPEQMYFNSSLQSLPSTNSAEQHNFLSNPRKRELENLESPEPTKKLKKLEYHKETEGKVYAV